MKSKKAEDKKLQAELDRIQVILNGYEYKSPLEKLGAIKARIDIADEIIYGNK